MAKISERVMDMVRRALDKNPEIRSSALYEQAKKADRAISRISLRQFHAQYPLQVKRLAAKNKGGRPRKVAAAAAAVKRGPGRPRKVAVVAGPAAAAVTAAAPRVAAPAAGNRDAVRAVLLEFATTVALAEGKAEMIGVVTRVDGWVDRVLKAAG